MRNFITVAVCFAALGLGYLAVEAQQDERQLLVEVKPGTIQLPQGLAKSSIHSTTFASAAFCSTLTALHVQDVEFAIPKYVTTLHLAPPAAPGRERPNVDNYFLLTFLTQQARDSAYNALVCHPDVLVTWKRVPIPFHAVIPNDSLFYRQWGLRNVGQAGGTYDADINADVAWETTTGDSTVILGIVDTGVRRNHPDFWGRHFLGDDTYYGQHGTGVCSIIAAKTNNNRGIAGVDWNCRVYTADANNGAGDIDFGKAYVGIIEAVDAGARGINTSFGWDSEVPLWRDAYRYALDNGVAMVASMGNTGNTLSMYPASYEGQGLIAVGAMRNTGVRSGFSSYGPWIDLIAPGGENPFPYTTPVDIQVAWFDTGSYRFLSGTSFSAPHVTGTIGLMLAICPSLLGPDIEYVLKITAQDRGDPGFDWETGYGLLRADAALNILKQPNTIAHVTVQGLTVQSVTGWEQRYFYYPGFVWNQPYYAKKYTLSKQVSFPRAYFTRPHAWGCGCESNGWTPGNPNYGVKYSGVDTSTITEFGFTVETYVYEVKRYSDGAYLGFFPGAPEEAVAAVSALGEELILGPALYAGLGDPTKVTVSWNDPNNNESGQRLYRRVGGSTTNYYIPLGGGSADFADTVASTPYKYWMNVWNVHQNILSDTVRVKYPPRSPDNIQATVLLGDPEIIHFPKVTSETPLVPTNQVLLTWQHSPSQPLGTRQCYSVQKAVPHCAWYPCPGGPYCWVCDTTWDNYPISASRTDTTLCMAKNTTYAFRVVAVDIYGDTNVVRPQRTVTTGNLDYCTRDLPVCDKQTIPDAYALSQNWPNPFNAATAITFSLPRPADVQLVVYDILGRRVRNLMSDHFLAGYQTIDWDGRDDRGDLVASGMYFYRLTAGDFTETRKMVLMK